MVIFDRFGRPLLQIRYSVTMRCNFKCFFCHMEGFTERNRELSLNDVEVLAEAFRRLGVEGVKLTGGEPLLREDVLEIIRVFRDRGLKVSATTNGYFLADCVDHLVSLGVDHVNVSLHSLRPEVFKSITGVDALRRVVEGILRAHREGLSLKLNMVVLRGLNDCELENMIEFASRYAQRLQLIELHTPTSADNLARFRVPHTEVLSKLMGRAARIVVRRDLHNRTILVLDNGFEVEVVGPMGNPSFCAACTRLRVGCDGSILPCLNWEGSPLSASHCFERESFEDKVQCYVELLRKVNALREPKCRYPARPQNVGLIPRIPRFLRLGLPKRGGSLMFTGSRAKHHLSLYLEEWRGFQVLLHDG